MSDLVKQVADAIELVTIERQGQGFHLVAGRNDSEAFARAALSVLEPRIEQLERELAEAREALADLTDAFLSRHGCFPMDQTNERERHWHRAMKRAYGIVGQPGTPARRNLAPCAAAAIRNGEAEQ